MAFNWNSALSGTASGASAGAAIGTAFGPGPGNLIGAGVGALGGFLAGGFGDWTQDPTNVNPYTAAQMQEFNNLSSMYGGQYNTSMGQVNDYENQMSEYLGQIGAYQPSASYDPNSYFKQLMSQDKSFQNMAKAGMGPYQTSAKNAAERASANAVRSAAAQFGSQGALNSSGAMKAIGEGAATPMANYETSLAQNYANLYGNFVNAGMQGNLQSQLGAYQGAMNADAQRLSALQAASQGYYNLGGLAQQRALGAAGLQQGYQTMLGGYAAPEWYMPATGQMAQGMSDAAGLVMYGANNDLFGTG